MDQAMRGDALRERLGQEHMPPGHDLLDAINDKIVGHDAVQITGPMHGMADPQLDREAHALRYALFLAPNADMHRQHEVAHADLIERGALLAAFKLGEPAPAGYDSWTWRHAGFLYENWQMVKRRLISKPIENSHKIRDSLHICAGSGSSVTRSLG